MLYIEPIIRTFTIGTRILEHPITDRAEGGFGESAIDRIRDNITHEKERLISQNQNQTPAGYNFTIKSIYRNILANCDFLCPRCEEAITYCRYTTTVHEYGTACFGINGIDDYDHEDSENQSTIFECPECDREISPESTLINIPQDARRLIEEFIQQINNNHFGQVTYNLPDENTTNRFNTHSWSAWRSPTTSMEINPTEQIGTNAMGNLTIATEDIIKEDIFTDQ